MDPTANLSEQLGLATEILLQLDAGSEISVDDTERLAELVIALDGWIRRKGHLPIPWQQEA